MTTKDKDEQDTLRLLVQYVSRAFYDPRFVVIMDQLARHPVLKDDDLAGRIGLQAKELNKYMAVLVNDRLVQVHRQNELKEGAQRSVGKQYYYIDYKHYCNVVKWRVSEMHRTIDSTLRNELDNKGYICPNCKSTFSPLEADRLLDISRGTFICDVCPTSPGGPHEVIPNEDEDKLRGSKDRMERFNHQTRFVRESLRKTDSMTLPAFDVAQWIRSLAADAERQKNAQGAAGSAGAGLKIAGAGIGAGGLGAGKQEDAGISVLMSVDKDEATQRREREAEAEAKRQQNVMPSWHLKSTISNDLTALGIAAVGRLKPEAKEKTEVIIVDEQKKTEEEQTAEFYDQYYAQLEARSAVQSASHTPQTKTLSSSDFSGSSSGSQTNVSLGTETSGLRLGLGITIGSHDGSVMEEERKPDITLVDGVGQGSAAGGSAGKTVFLASSSSGSLKRSRSGSLDASTSFFSSGSSGAAVSSGDTATSETLVMGGRGLKALRSNAGTPVPAPVPLLSVSSYVSERTSLERSQSPSVLDVGSVPVTDIEDEGVGKDEKEVKAEGKGGGEEGVGSSEPLAPSKALVNEPVVMVGGESMPLSSVTQEIADEKMTPEEYTIWVELVMGI